MYVNAKTNPKSNSMVKQSRAPTDIQ